MLPNPDHCYAALLSRDARFDGRLFVGVTSTGVYCRPICRVRAPKAENCRYFASAAAAEAAGFRPCLKCRPELAPGRAAVDAGPRLARAAARLIEHPGADGEPLAMAEVARRLGVGERHLRRVFLAEYGVSPAAHARSRRLLLAKQLLTETALPVTEVAYAAGFGSLRACDTAFRLHYRLSPSDLRRHAPAHAASGADRLQLAYRPPLDWSALLAFLARRSIAGVETVGDGRYLRSVRGSDGRTGWIEVSALPGRDALGLRLSPGLWPDVSVLLPRARRLFDLDCEPDTVAACLRDGGLAVPIHPGLRVPGAWEGFEMAVRAILGQQISVAAATTLAGRLAARFGTPLAEAPPGLSHLFPTPADLAGASVDDIASLGIVSARARALRALAQAVAEGLLLSPAAPLEETRQRLLALPGIGPWTVEYIAMRALAWPDAFPAEDVALRKVLGGVSARQALAASEAWRPWRSYAVINLWHSLEQPS